MSSGDVLIFFSAIIVVAFGQAFQQVFLDENSNFSFQWKTSKNSIRVNMTCQAQGWCGVGFSPSGTMEKADIVIAWFDNEQNVHLSGRLGPATGNGFPRENPDQYYTLLAAWKNDTSMSVTFKRQLSVEPISSFNITPGPVQVIWAYHRSSVPEDENTIEQHTDRGMTSVELIPLKVLKSRSAAVITAAEQFDDFHGNFFPHFLDR